MNDYTPNSNRFKEQQRKSVEEKEKAQKVVSGQTTVKKKSETSKILGSFMHVDGPKLVEYMIWDVLVPTAKKTISTCVDMILYGDSGRNKSNVPASKVSYNNYYGGRGDDRRREDERRSRSALDYDDIEFSSRGDAEIVLDRMCDWLSRYGVVTIGDYYDLAGQSNYNHCIHKYGWMNLSTARVVSLWNGKYTIDLPKAVPVD